MEAWGQVTGAVTYNGKTFDEFLPQSTSVYVPQEDQHMAELTVRETFNFAARCQGMGVYPGEHLWLDNFWTGIMNEALLTGPRSPRHEKLGKRQWTCIPVGGNRLCLWVTAV